MLKPILILAAMLPSVALYSQTFYTGFEDGSLEGWTNPNGSKKSLKIQTDVYNYLEKKSLSDNEELSIVNESTDYWAGNYFIEAEDGETLRTVDDILFKNPNPFDLYIRYGFKGANGYMVVTTTPIVIKAHSDWEAYSNFYYPYFEAAILDNLTIINDTGTKSWEEVMADVRELFTDVVEFKILHNPNISYQGAKVKGTLEMESIVSWEKTPVSHKVVPSLSIYPNPLVDKVYLSAEESIENITIYNAQGTVIFRAVINDRSKELDVSFLNSGVYLFEIGFDNGKALSKKLVKL